MEQVKRTNRDIMRFVNAATSWQHQQTNGKEPSVTGFKYAISRVIKSTAKAVEDFNDEATDINIDCAASDEQQIIRHDERGNTMFTKEDSKKRNKLLRALQDKEVEIGIHFSKTTPDDLTPFQLQSFEGFVIKEVGEPGE